MSGERQRPPDAASSTPPLGPSLLAEALGAFALSLGSLGAIHLAREGLLPEVAAFTLTPGLIVLAVVYVIGDVSGAHINPAVTLAFALRGSFPWGKVAPYLLAQLLGATLAAAVLRAFTELPAPAERILPFGALGLEVACTTLLVLVILATAKRKAKVGPNVGLVVGATVALCQFATNAVSDVGMNPTKALGPALVALKPGGVWPHVVGPLVGGVLATGLTRALRGPPNEDEGKAGQGDGEGA